MVLSALATYGGVLDDYTSSVLLIAALSGLITVPCSGAWTLFGASLSRLLADPRVTRPFNWTMAALLIASIAPVIFE
jgi:threonine/homoserine/homoserine lactone efflux protein